MNVAEAVAALGVGDTDAGVLVFARKTKDDRMRHYRLAEIGTRDAGDNLYLASALFAPTSIDDFKGRSEGNIVRILWLPFDFDLVTFSGIPKEQLYDMPDTALTPWINALVERVDTVFEHLGLTLHRIDYTGYGIAGYLNVPPHDPDAVPRIRQLHKSIVAQVNAVAREKLADPQVSDAGTRIMRLVPTLNTKNPDRPRVTRTIRMVPGVVTEAQLIHAAGEISPPPTRLVPETGSLLDADTIDKIVTAVRPHWVEGNRHGVALAMGALFAKAGVPEDQCMGIVESLAAGDGEAHDRRKAVHTSYERVRTGLPVRGFYGLQDFLPVEVTQWLDGIASKVRQATTPRLLIGGEVARKPVSEEKEEAYAAQFPPPPEICYFGLFKDYRDVMAPTSEAPDAFHLGAALTLVGAMIGRRVRAEYASDPLFANLYTVLIGASGSSRKDTAMRRATNLPFTPGPNAMRIVTPAFKVHRDISSSEGLVSILKETPNTMLYLSELSIVQKNAARKGTSTIFDRMIEAWDSPPVLQNLNKQTPQTAENPYLSILAATQPKRLADQMTAEDMHSGFANRWLYVIGAGKEPMARPPGVDRRVAWAIYDDWFDAISKYPEGTVLTFDSTGDERWDDWYYTNARKNGRDEDEDAMRIRHPTIAQKLALIYAISEHAPSIGDRHLEPAIALIDWMWPIVKEMMQGWGVSIDIQIELAITRCLERAGEPLHRSVLQKRTKNRKWSGKDFASVFDAMVKNGHVQTDPMGYVGLRGMT